MGLYAGAVELAPDQSGKRKRRTLYGKTEAEVLAKLKATQREIDDGGPGTTPERITISRFLTKWLTDSAPQRATTLRSYTGVVEGHLLGAHGIGAKRLRELRPADIEALYARLRRNGTGDRTLQLTHAVLRRALRHALRQGLIVRNPATLVDAPAYRPSSMKPLTNAQLKKLLAAAKGDRLEALYVLAVFSGARQGELLGLQWGDLDAKRGTLQIVRSLQDVNGKIVIAEPKTRRSRRQVYLAKPALEALARHREAALAAGLEASAGDFIFRAPGGGPMNRTNLVARSFKPLLERAGLPDARFHDLRHSFATSMLTIGTHPKIVQEALGHATIGTTLDTYSHVLPSLAREAASKLGAALAPVSKRR